MGVHRIFERYPVVVLLAALGAGLWLGSVAPGLSAGLGGWIWPTLAALLYVTFCQVPLENLGAAFQDRRFLAAAGLGNFIVLPAVASLLILLAPDDTGVRVGILLVLLVPCTDWFIAFTHLAGGDARRAIAFTPLSLLLQFLLLPIYLWLFLGTEVVTGLVRVELASAFAGLVLLPLLAAIATQRWVKRDPGRTALMAGMDWLPVPLLAVVVLLVAASQYPAVAESLGILGRALVVFALFTAIAVAISRILAGAFRLRARQGRTLAFSFATRNSFVVLPIALALPGGYGLASVVVVLQSVVELFAMIFLLWFVPSRVFPAKPSA